MVDCGRDLAAAKDVWSAAKTTYLRLGPVGDNLTEVSDEHFFGLRLLVNGLGVGDMTIVPVQALREKVQVSGLESLAPF